MNKQVDEYILQHKDEMISVLCDSLRIPSEKGTSAAGAPFGVEVKNALTHILGIAQNMGFKCTDMDGYIGCIDYGYGDELLGVMCHVDVVPANSGWTYPPYSATIVDGNIYSRGAMDDKGPAISTLYALAAIKACKLPMTRRVRIMLGCDEESGWGCMEHYEKHGEMPHLAFSPDGDYPLVYSEKGILRVDFCRKFKSQITFEAGSRANVVPDSALVTIPFDVSTVSYTVANLKEDLERFDISIQAQDNGTVIRVNGLGAHASLPHLGRNALQAAILILANLPLIDEDKLVIMALNNLFKLEYNGQSLGFDKEDESGRMTVNVGVMRWGKDGIEQFSTDMRCPISLPLEELYGKYTSMLEKTNFVVYDKELKDGHIVPRDSELVQKLLSVYAARTGTTPEPLAIGGGTYARAIKNAVAFGCEHPEAESTVHMPNEFIPIKDMMDNTYMIADAIIALATSENN